MDMNFAIGLSQGIAWPWPIAVYLFLAGISGGAVAAAVILNLYRKQAHENTPVLKAASVIGAATILLGMVCLVLDLTNPFNFWRILIYYNPTSVMSLGVMALLVYIPTVCILTLVALRGLLPKVGLGFLDGIVGFFDGWRVVLQWIALVFALTICAYTGFLISALIRFPLINQAVLPALFVASGLSAGMAATKAFACLAFGDRHESCDQHLLHAAEWPVMAAEALCIFMIAVALVNGNAAAQAAFAAFTTGAWAIEFWVGVVCVGDALRPVPDLPATQTFDMRFYRDAVAQLKSFERIGALTGCTHASVWIRPDGTPAGGAEDVGRHVALDKLLGLRAREGWRDGALVVSSRASYEMVQKAAMCGVEILFAVSAPTALAVRTAERCGMTLAAFARAGGPNVYTHPERLVGAQDERLCA